MIVGLPKEIKVLENRVGMTPAGVKGLTDGGHTVRVQKNAGLGAMITDEEYIQAGAIIVETAAEAWNADMVVKVKEPQPVEYDYFKQGQIVYTYLHLAPEPELTKALLDKGVTGIAYETVQLPSGALPLLAPMSEVAGRMSIQVAAHLLTKKEGGMGVLLGGAAGVEAAHVVIIGAGVVGLSAAKVAMGMGARVTIIDNSLDRLRFLGDVYESRMQTLASNSFNIASAVKSADVVVGSVLVPGALAPQLVTEDMVKTMKKGAVIVDVAIDQGGSVETTARNGATTHENPTFMLHDVVHYCVGNMPGAVARTATFALTNATLPYMLLLANKGWKAACQGNASLAKGINTHDGKVFYDGVANAFGYDLHELSEIL